MPDVKLAGRLPGTVERNGVTHVASSLATHGLIRRVALVVYDAPTRTENDEEGTITPTMRVRWIEDMGTEAEQPDLVELMNKAAEDRTGNAALPLDTEPADPGDGTDESELVT